MKILLLDNFDSFTFMLRDLVEQSGVECVVKRNDDPDAMLCDNMDAVMISPGPGRPEDSGCLMELIEKYCITKPMLGVCLGQQALGVHFGASLVKADQPKHGKTSAVRHNGDALFKGIPSTFQATRYHSLVLKDIPSTLEVTAVSDQGEAMAIRHTKLKLWGIQFHPESCMTPHGTRMLKNFTHLVKTLG